MNFSNGINASKESYGKGRKMISVMDILDEIPIHYKNIRNSVDVNKDIEDKSKVEKGDLIFVRSSEVVEEVGWSKAYLENEYSLHSGFTIRGKKKGKFDARFIELILNSSNRKQIERKAGGSTRFNVSQSILKDIIIREADIEEQTKISNFIAKLDDTIALHKRKLDLLEQLKQGYLQDMFPQKEESVPKLRFANFDSNWEQRKFQDFTKLSQGLQIAIDKRFLVPGKNRVFYITNEFLNPNSSRRYYIESPLKSMVAGKEDILMTRTGNTGKVVTNVEGAFHNNFFKITYMNSKIAKLFLYYLLNSFLIQKEIIVRAGTSTIPDLNHNEFYKIKVNVPVLEEQQRIGSLLKQLNNTIALHQSKLEKIQSLKKIYLQKMFI